MEVISAIQVLKDRLYQIRHNQLAEQVKIGLVPTMGYLHQGHVSLVERARQQCDVVVLSIFVNPLQFGPNEDFERYPRDVERDLQMLRETGVEIVFVPDVKEMYPREPKTGVYVSQLTERLCGASRPGHFDGVTTVVCKLFNIVQPDTAFFGSKDAQQIAVIEQMVVDLNLPVTIVPCPTIREADGLAMSSRNRYLNPEERKQALKLSEALQHIDEWVKETSNSVQLTKRITDYILQASMAVIDYVEILTYPGLQPIADLTQAEQDDRAFIVALAVKFGNTRLIDNKIVPFSILADGGK